MSLTQARAEAIASMIAGDLWTRHDASVIERLFADDIVYRDVSFGYRLEGRTMVRGYFDQVTHVFENFFEELQEVLPINDHTIVARWQYGGYFNEPSLGAVGHVRLPGMSVITLRGDRVVANDDYYDGNTFLKQVGLDGHTPATFLALRAEKAAAAAKSPA